MRAGRLRHPIILESPSTTQNTRGEVVDGPFVQTRTRASVEPLQGRELWEAQKVNPRITTRVRMRYHPDVSAYHRLKLLATDGPESVERTYGIVAVLDPEQRHRELELLCEEVQ